MMDKTLLKTIHGSHLYGLAHADSDQDYYTVISRSIRGTRKKYARQNITDGIDSMTVDLSTFRHFCDEGVPQALEALFSPIPEIDEITDFRNAYTVSLPNVSRTYKRTIRNFINEGSFKRRRHGVRLQLNLDTMIEHGRFNPRLDGCEIAQVNEIAGWPDEDLFDWLGYETTVLDDA